MCNSACMVIFATLFEYQQYATLIYNVPWLQTVLAQGTLFNYVPMFLM